MKFNFILTVGAKDVKQAYNTLHESLTREELWNTVRQIPTNVEERVVSAIEVCKSENTTFAQTYTTAHPTRAALIYAITTLHGLLKLIEGK